MEQRRNGWMERKRSQNKLIEGGLGLGDGGAGEEKK